MPPTTPYRADCSARCPVPSHPNFPCPARIYVHGRSTRVWVGGGQPQEAGRHSTSTQRPSFWARDSWVALASDQVRRPWSALSWLLAAPARGRELRQRGDRSATPFAIYGLVAGSCNIQRRGGSLRRHQDTSTSLPQAGSGRRSLLAGAGIAGADWEPGFRAAGGPTFPAVRAVASHGAYERLRT